MEFEDDIKINELSPSNYYEAQVLSQLHNWKGKRLTYYRYPNNLPFNLTEIRNKFSEQMRGEYFKDIQEKNNCYQSARFEVDLYFQPCPDNEVLISTRGLLSASISELNKITDIDEGSMSKKWIFIELTQGPQFITQKLWQLERALLLIPHLDENVLVGSVIILVNGDKKEFDIAMKSLRPIPANSKLSKLPVYIGWVSTRNIYSTLNQLSTTMTTFGSDLECFKGDLKCLKGDLECLRDDVRVLKETMADSQRTNIVCFAIIAAIMILSNRWR